MKIVVKRFLKFQFVFIFKSNIKKHHYDTQNYRTTNGTQLMG